MFLKKFVFFSMCCLAFQCLAALSLSAQHAAQFAVQTETLSFEPAARAVVNRLRGSGYDAYFERFAAPDGKVLYKVRFGRFATREQAATAAREYKRREQRDCFVVQTMRAPAPASPAAESRPEPVASGTDNGMMRPSQAAGAAAVPAGESMREFYTVQVAAKTDRSVAQALAERLHTGGYPVYILLPGAEDEAPLYRVRFGRYASRAKADLAGRSYAAKENGDFLVVLSTDDRLEDALAAGLAVPAAPGQAVSASPPSETEYVYTVQLCVRETRASAERYAARVRAKGFEPYIVRYDAPTGATLYRVRMGCLPDRAGADELGRAYMQKGGREYLVVRTEQAVPEHGRAGSGAEPPAPRQAQPASAQVPVPATPEPAPQEQPPEMPEREGLAAQPAEWPARVAKVYAYSGPDNELNLTNAYANIPRQLLGRIQYVSVFPVAFVDVAETGDGFVMEVEGVRRTVRPDGIRLPAAQRSLAVAAIRQQLSSQPLRLKYSPSDERNETLPGSLYYRAGQDVQLELLKRGVVVVDDQSLPAGHAEEFRSAQKRARDLKAGIWAEIGH